MGEWRYDPGTQLDLPEACDAIEVDQKVLGDCLGTEKLFRSSSEQSAKLPKRASIRGFHWIYFVTY
jgi:hypothetical protein